ncbi:MAG: sulfatase-like hydrolase/transferase, partial [Planctomycetota bacterium]
LASEAIRLTDFHVAPMCTPTRGQFLTGIDAFRNRASNVSSGRTLLREDLPTIADRFREAGYRTGLFGKWHLGDNVPFRPQDRGFDESLWFPSSHIGSVPDYWNNDYFDDTYIHNGVRESVEGYCTDVFFEAAKTWMADDSERPFFAFIPTNAAHSPWFVPDEFRKPIRKAINRQPELVEHLNKRSRENLISFLAMGANIDANVGELDGYLKRNGLFDDTIVVFLTDNGSTRGEDYFNAGMRGRKTQLWDGGHRVPCFIRWPDGEIRLACEIDELCQVQDLFPTLLDLAGIDPSTEFLDGQSLGPLIRGEIDTLDDRMLVINYSRMPGMKVTYTDGNPAVPRRDGAAVLWRKWRLLENRMLFDIATDPHQDHDVADQHTEVVAKMRDHLNSWWDNVKDTVNQPERVRIGSDAENPMLLTACEWLDVFVDQQKQVRAGVRKNGTWHLNVAKSGSYRLECRRWPRESGLKLDEGTTSLNVTDGSFAAGRALPIDRATVSINGEIIDAVKQPDGESFVAMVQLDSGPVNVRTSLQDAAGSELCGAYYLHVQRLPNLVVMMSDDMGFSDLGCYGGEIETPNLDRLANEGLRFRTFYNNAKCEHTRASLLTGHYWHHVGASARVHYSEPTFGERLRDAGYRTLMVGKWHAGQTPHQRGFDRHYGLTDGCCNFWNPGHARDGEPEPAKKRVRRWAIDDQEFLPYQPPSDDFYTTDAFTDYAIDYVREYADQPNPLLLYAAYTAPHYPMHASQQDVAKYRGRYGKIGWDRLRTERFARQQTLGVLSDRAQLTRRDPDLPAWDDIPQQDRDLWDLRMATYAAMVDRMDRNIGRLLATLRETGRLDDTLILFLSDNGACEDSADRSTVPNARPWEVTSYMTQGRTWANASNTPYRKYKTTNFEGGTRTPLIAWWPGRIGPGTITDDVGHLIDITPTLLELAGRAVPDSLPGRSLIPTFEAKPNPRVWPLAWEFNKARAIRDARYKLVRYGKADWELYDLQMDPTEQHDLAEEQPDRVASMSLAWQRWRETSLADD